MKLGGKRKKVGIYERPRSADVNYIKILVWVVSLMLALIALYRWLR